MHAQDKYLYDPPLQHIKLIQQLCQRHLLAYLDNRYREAGVLAGLGMQVTAGLSFALHPPLEVFY